MKASLSFSLPEDEEEFDNARNGTKYRSLIEAVEGYVTAQMKHGDIDDGERAAYTDVLSQIEGIAEDMGLELY